MQLGDIPLLVFVNQTADLNRRDCDVRAEVSGSPQVVGNQTADLNRGDCD